MADKEFASYRGKELGRLKLDDGDQFYRLKVLGANGETKWLNITPTELERITEALEPEDYRDMLAKLSAAFRRGEEIPDIP